MKISLQGYYEHTPAFIRKIADSVMGACTFASSYAAVISNDAVALKLAFCAIAAKFLSNFFSETPATPATTTATSTPVSPVATDDKPAGQA